MTTYAEEMARAETAEREFRERNGVREYRNSPRNVRTILRSAGADDAMVERAADAIRVNLGGMLCGPFDHGKLYGRDRTPLMLVGHPYHLGDDDARVLEAVRACGLSVHIDGFSLYGFGTIRIIVASADFDIVRQ